MGFQKQKFFEQLVKKTQIAYLILFRFVINVLSPGTKSFSLPDKKKFFSSGDFLFQGLGYMFQDSEHMFQALVHKFRSWELKIFPSRKTFSPKGRKKYSQGQTNVIYAIIIPFSALVINKNGMLSTFSAECRPKSVLISHF